MGRASEIKKALKIIIRAASGKKRQKSGDIFSYEIYILIFKLNYNYNIFL